MAGVRAAAAARSPDAVAAGDRPQARVRPAGDLRLRARRLDAPAVQHDHAVFLRPAGRAVLRAMRSGRWRIRCSTCRRSWSRSCRPTCAIAATRAIAASAPRARWPAVLFTYMLFNPWGMIGDHLHPGARRSCSACCTWGTRCGPTPGRTATSTTARTSGARRSASRSPWWSNRDCPAVFVDRLLAPLR